MQEVMSGVQTSFNMAGGSVGLSALFMAGLIVLWYSKFDKKRTANVLFWYSIVMLIFVVNPVYISFVENKAPGLKTNNLYLWLIPTAPVILYSAINVISLLKDKFSNNKAKKIAFAVGLAGIFILAIMTSYSGFEMKLTKDLSYFDKYEEDVFENIESYRTSKQQEFVTIAGPDEILEDARKYSGYFNTLYGKEMWNGAFDTQLNYAYESWQYTLYEYIHNAHEHVEDIAETCIRNGCEIIVLGMDSFVDNSAEIPESLSDRYYLGYTNEKYLVYYKSAHKD